MQLANTQHGIRHYFAYGSNMNTQRVIERGLQYSQVQSGRLMGYRLAFNKMSKDHEGIGHANIEFARSSIVEGVLYTLEDDAEILKMDPFENAPWNYGRDAFVIETTYANIWSWSYVANSAVRRIGLQPSAAYLAHLLAGKPYISEAYYANLADRSTHSV